MCTVQLVRLRRHQRVDRPQAFGCLISREPFPSPACGGGLGGGGGPGGTSRARRPPPRPGGGGGGRARPCSRGSMPVGSPLPDPPPTEVGFTRLRHLKKDRNR